MRYLISVVFCAVVLSLPATAAASAMAPLVSVDWLAEHNGDDDLVVLDIRNAIDGGDRATFEQGHIPGAVYSSYTEAGWRQKSGDVPGTLPPTEELETLIGSLGIDNDTDVVIVPAGVGSTDFGSATRVYWTFKVLGHDRVSILNGGHRAWVEAEQPIAEGWNEPQAAEFDADWRPELVADAEAVEQARNRDAQLIDNRPAEQFRGEDKHSAARAAGTIPDAVNLEQQKLTRDGTAFMVDRDVVATLLDEVGVTEGERAITFCNTGHWASMGWFALSEIAGHDNVALYDGSMTDWTQEDNRALKVGNKGIARVVDWLSG